MPFIVPAIPYIALGLSAIATGAGVAGTVAQGNAQAKAADFQATEAGNNKAVAEAAAYDAIARGQHLAQQYLSRGERINSALRVGAAANGLLVEGGSNPALQSQNTLFSGLDAAQAINNAAREAMGFRSQGLAYGMAAEFARQNASDIGLGTGLAAFGRAAGGAGSLLGMANQFGMFDRTASYTTTPTSTLGAANDTNFGSSAAGYA
jgi:hypothetical protein